MSKIKDIKTIEKQVKILEKIKAIDADILKLDKIGRLVNDGALSQSVKISIGKQPIKKIEVEEEVYVYKMHSWNFDLGCGNRDKKPKDENTESFESEISDVLTYEILGVLINKKMEERNNLINKINKL